MIIEIPDHATRRAVRDLLGAGIGEGAGTGHVAVEMGQHLQNALTSDAGDGATPLQLLAALQDESGPNPVIYARLLELSVLATLDEVSFLTSLPDPENPIEPRPSREPVVPLRRNPRRRR